jgi:hypothetical protein
VNFKVGEIVQNIRSDKFYKITYVGSSLVCVKRVFENGSIAKKGSRQPGYIFRKLTKLEKALK